ncbi:MAG: DUF192 domain-containing protein [Thermoleophilia bacterium]
MSRRRGILTLRRDDGRIICEAVTVADRSLQRVRGLLGRRTLPAGEGITLRPAWSIHTAFMQFPIDVVFVDAEQVVIGIEHGLRPFRAASCRGAREVVELAAGECERYGLETGDRIAWAARSIVNTIVARENPGLRATSRATVLIISADQRFIKIARFLLESREIAVGNQTMSQVFSQSLADVDLTAVLIDAGTSLGDGLRVLNVTRAQRPELQVVIVAESTSKNTPASVRVYDKWNEMEAVIQAIEQAIAPLETTAR